eukprot:TRINITY_DN1540_c0_g1_i1.p1 TRINITY_DN1540_c0_g1~~TRINITY_DN1540_c0_g1_i1.p1  ORF type:complete len:881 (+),score=311.21 TRINITY_DN1540_c0_g1_i1:80-2722(+)
MTSKTPGQTLPPSVQALHKSIYKLYGSKQYKKGLKAADQVLAKAPNHGETLALKGLIYNAMEKKEEAMKACKSAVQNDIRNHVCWHALGVVHRSDRNYVEAIKCYTQGLKSDPENLQILRDLSNVQVQARNLDGYAETRRKILTLKPNQRANWIAYAMAEHMRQNYSKALDVLSSWKSTANTAEKEGYEYSEALLYINMVMEEGNRLEQALRNLDDIEKDVVDKLSLKEKKASLLHKNRDWAGAEKAYRALIDLNPDNVDYHKHLIAVKTRYPASQGFITTKDLAYLTEEQTSSLSSLYSDLKTKYPRCIAVRRMPLDFLKGDSFRACLSDFIQPDLRKGVPSTFIVLKALYLDSSKRNILGEVLENTLSSLESVGRFPNSSPDSEKENPSVTLWAMFLVAQHYDRIGKYKEAIERAEKAIKHTPTVIDLYMFQAKVYKHAGDPQNAWKMYEAAREMDLADRYLNTKATLYALRADRVEVAEKTIALFTSKEGADPQDTLKDMQCMWYEIECGKSRLRTGDYGKGLKKLLDVDKHFTDIIEDQFDFHAYCSRKMTLRSYIKVLRLEDRVQGHYYYQEAMKTAVRTWLAHHDAPPPSSLEDPSLAGLSDKERKAKAKADRLKAQRAAERAEKKAAEEKGKQPAAATSSAAAAAANKPVDPDPEGKKLLEGDVLEKCAGYLKTLNLYQKNDIENCLLACEVHLRRHKLLQVVQSLNRAHRINSSHPSISKIVVELAIAAEQHPLDGIPGKLLKEAVQKFTQGKTPQQYLENLIQSQKSLPSLISAVKINKILNNKTTALSLLLPSLTAGEGVTLEAAQEALRFIKSETGPYSADSETFRSACLSRFPLASDFSLPQTFSDDTPTTDSESSSSSSSTTTTSTA